MGSNFVCDAIVRCLRIVVTLTGRFGFAFFLVVACACAQSAVSTVAQPESQRTVTLAAPQPSRTPQVWEGPGETTPPLPIVRGAALDVAPPSAAPRALALPALADGAKLRASGGSVAYYFTGTDQEGVVHALDLATGAERWQAGGLRAYDAVASSALLFAGRVQADGNGGTVALDALTGRVVATLPSVDGGHVLDGYFYAYRYREHSTAFVAFDGRSGREIWESLGTGGVGGQPALVGTTLLQSFSESGAITINAMHGFDVVTGRERWARGYGPAPLGVAGNLIYLDSTWFPVQLDAYFPLAVMTLDVTTGTALHGYGYKPDAARNWPRKPNTPYGATGSHVAGGFVYLQVAGAWYRYDADRPPADAHPVRLDGVNDIAAWFDGGAMIVSSAARRRSRIPAASGSRCIASAPACRGRASACARTGGATSSRGMRSMRSIRAASMRSVWVRSRALRLTISCCGTRMSRSSARRVPAARAASCFSTTRRCIRSPLRRIPSRRRCRRSRCVSCSIPCRPRGRTRSTGNGGPARSRRDPAARWRSR